MEDNRLGMDLNQAVPAQGVIQQAAQEQVVMFLLLPHHKVTEEVMEDHLLVNILQGLEEVEVLVCRAGMETGIQTVLVDTVWQHQYLELKLIMQVVVVLLAHMDREIPAVWVAVATPERMGLQIQVVAVALMYIALLVLAVLE